jgi:hypothetical protein
MPSGSLVFSYIAPGRYSLSRYQFRFAFGSSSGISVPGIPIPGTGMKRIAIQYPTSNPAIHNTMPRVPEYSVIIAAARYAMAIRCNTPATRHVEILK